MVAAVAERSQRVFKRSTAQQQLFSAEHFDTVAKRCFYPSSTHPVAPHNGPTPQEGGFVSDKVPHQGARSLLKLARNSNVASFKKKIKTEKSRTAGILFSILKKRSQIPWASALYPHLPDSPLVHSCCL